MVTVSVFLTAWWLFNDFREAARSGSPVSGSLMEGINEYRSTNAERSDGRSDQILSCTDKDGNSFYTNALRCEDADLSNRVNVVPTQSPGKPVAAQCLGIASADRAHFFLPECQETFSQALDLETFISKASDPLQSSRLPEYCSLIAEGVGAGCMATTQTFCYLSYCQQLLE